MRVPILLPDLGADPVILSFWYARTGDDLFAGERVVEVLADGITFDVAAPANGRLTEQLAFVDSVVSPGQILGTIDADNTDS
jgi:2-oxoglutarate dehydrogenase E2 component (dihydrolipoamide succinyltransferase)